MWLNIGGGEHSKLCGYTVVIVMPIIVVYSIAMSVKVVGWKRYLIKI